MHSAPPKLILIYIHIQNLQPEFDPAKVFLKAHIYSKTAKLATLVCVHVCVWGSLSLALCFWAHRVQETCASGGRCMFVYVLVYVRVGVQMRSFVGGGWHHQYRHVHIAFFNTFAILFFFLLFCCCCCFFNHYANRQLERERGKRRE